MTAFAERVAQAMVMADCPMLAQASAQPEMGAGHDCCPDDAPAAPTEVGRDSFKALKLAA